MKHRILTILLATVAITAAYAKSFVGFEANGNLQSQVDNGLIQNQVNMTLVDNNDPYQIKLTTGGTACTFTMGGVTFYYKNSQSGKLVCNVYNDRIVPDGKDREIRIPTQIGDQVKVVLTQACTSILINGEAQTLNAGENILTATGESIILKTTSDDKPNISAILPKVEAETITVAQALAKAADLEPGETDEDLVAVEAYVINAEPFDLMNGNQSWFMADEAETTVSDFYAYRCVPRHNDETVKVLNGDKVRIEGHLKKYHDNTLNRDLIEITAGTISFISMTEGDHSVNTTIEKITVAQALEIGAPMETGTSSPVLYEITGYVSATADDYSSTYKNQSFWIADGYNTGASSNAEGAFYVYRGKPDTERALVIGSRVRLTTLIRKYSSGPNGIQSVSNVEVTVLSEPEPSPEAWYCATSSWGYAGTNVTGGGNATPTLVTNASDLSNAIQSNSVVIVTQDIEVNHRISKEVSNFTLMALPGVKIISNQRNKENSGIFIFKGSSNNILLRNLTLVGPGAYDVNGYDLLSLEGATNVWVDHCDFQDGMDGNFDIKAPTDSVTVTWCRFRYFKEPIPAGEGGESDDHRFSNLVGSDSDNMPDDGVFNITYGYCWWDEGCKQRMVRCRNSELHFINCYWNSSVADYYVGPEKSSCYFEGCKFEGHANYSTGIWKTFYDDPHNCRFMNCEGNLPENSGNVAVPAYLYPHLNGIETKYCVTDIVCGAGATLTVTTAGEVSTACTNAEPQPDPVPTVEDLVNAGYHVADSVVVCMKLPTPGCYGIGQKPVYFYGSYNNWLDDLTDESQWEKQHWFSPLTGFDGWYVTEVPFNNSSVEAKPIVILSDNKIHWKYQGGDAEAYTYVAGKHANVTNSTIDGEAVVTYPETGAYIYELGYWKNHIDPCSSTPPFSVQVTFYPPYLCEGLTPAVTGDFNDWTATPMTEDTDYMGKAYYKATIYAENGDQLQFRVNESNAYPLLRKDGNQWVEYNRTLENGYSVYADCSDILTYRFGDCQKPNITSATATVFIPTDCSMDISNGLYMCWWPSSDEYTPHYVKMNETEARLYSVTFNPNAQAYSYFFLNASVEGEGTVRTEAKERLMDDSLCWELYYIPDDYYTQARLFADGDCSHTDHDYRPSNLAAVNTNMDTVRFEWNAPEETSSFEIIAYDAQNNSIFYANPSSWDGLQQEGNHYIYSKPIGVTDATVITYWTLRATMYIEGKGSLAYKSIGDTIHVAGDTRIPHNLAITEKSDGVYTLTWESSGEVDHYRIQIGWWEVYNTTNLSYDLTLEDNRNYDIRVAAMTVNDEPIGEAAISINTTKHEPVDITMYFYIPQTLGFLGEAGGAIVWRDPQLANEHIVPLVADGENGHWYKAVIGQFKRDRFRFSLINATTPEAANDTLAYDQDMSYYDSNERKFAVYLQRESGNLILSEQDANNFYPHDYAITGMSAEQNLDKIILSWTANEKATAYRVQVYRPDGETWWGEDVSDTMVVVKGLDNVSDTVTLTWSVSPRAEYWSYSSLLTAYSEMKVGPSPFMVKNMQAVNNNDGTFTFSWSPVDMDTVKSYYVQIYDPDNRRLSSVYTEDTVVMLPLQLLFSGKHVMQVYSLDFEENRLAEAVDTFEVAPTAERNIAIRVLMTSQPEQEMSEGLQFEVTNGLNNTQIVDAQEEKYGWWSCNITTDQYGILFRLRDEGSVMRVYADTCVEYVGGHFNAVECDARVSDYIPHHLQATPNGDGTYTLMWIMDATERVIEYNIEITNNDSVWYEMFSAQTSQCVTPLLPYTGNYIYTVRVQDEGWNTIGEASDTFFVAPLPEREIVLRVLEQPLEEGWIGVRVYKDWDYTYLNIRDEVDEYGNPTRWCTDTIRTSEPAIRIYLQSRWYERTEFWMSRDTCIQVENGFHEVSCDAKAQNFDLTNLQAESLGNGKVSFAWECEANPERFYLQTLVISNNNDTTALTYQYIEGTERGVTVTLNLDSVTRIAWYVMTVKSRQERSYGLSSAYGNTIMVEPSAYAPKNLQALPNSNGTYTANWNAEPDSIVAYYQVQLRYPNGERESWRADDTCFVTPVLAALGMYQVYVYSMGRNNTSLGWQSITFYLEELPEERDITIRLLLHPDATRDLDWLYVNGDEIEPVSEGNCWYSYTFSSRRPVQPVWLMDRTVNVVGDTCFEFSGNLTFADCDALPHDYRLIRDSMIAVSEPGKITFRWSGVEKAEQYGIRLWTYDGDIWIEETVTDTCYVFLVPDEADGKKLNWSVRPTAPHYLDETECPNRVTMQRNAIIFSDLQATTTDSITYHFSWMANTDTIQYEIMIYQYSESFRIRQEKLVNAMYDYTFVSSEGGWFYNWKVRAVAADGKPLSAWTDSENSVEVKPGLKAISNVQSSSEGNIITFTWDSQTTRTACRLYYIDPNDRWSNIPIISKDSLLPTNSFSYTATGDGQYMIILIPYVEVSDGEYGPLQEQVYANGYVFSTPTFHVELSTTVGGNFSWGNPSGNYPEGYVVNINVYAEDHYRFIGWSDGEKSSERELVVAGDTALIALFERRQEHTLTLFATEGGSLLIYTTNDTTAYYQTVVEEGYGFGFEVIPDEGYMFYGWSDGNSDENRNITLTSDSTLTAIFRPVRYAVITAGEGGRVQVTGAEYDKANKRYEIMEGGELTIRANADENYRFVAWSDGDVNVNRTLVVSSDTIISARFEEIGTPLEQYVVRVMTNDIQLGTVSQVSGMYYEGDQLTISAHPMYNTCFVEWSDGVKEATRVITVTQDTTLIAIFDYKKATLVIHASEGGSVNDSTANGTYPYDTWVTIVATPDEHYRFVQWSDGDVNASRSLHMTENTELTAIFAIEQFLVTFLNVDGALIEANWWNTGQTPVCGETPTLEPTAEYEFIFTGWTPEIAPVTSNAVYTATYDTVPRTPQAIEEIDIEHGAINEASHNNARKVLRNGTIFILCGDRVYTIDGRLVR